MNTTSFNQGIGYGFLMHPQDFKYMVGRCFSAAASNGWWNRDLQLLKEDIRHLKPMIIQKLTLITSEFFEMYEAMREGNYAKRSEEYHVRLDTFTDNREKYAENFKNLIKDTYEDEVADVYIRAMDLTGFLMWVNARLIGNQVVNVNTLPETVAEFVLPVDMYLGKDVINGEDLLPRKRIEDWGDYRLSPEEVYDTVAMLMNMGYDTKEEFLDGIACNSSMKDFSFTPLAMLWDYLGYGFANTYTALMDLEYHVVAKLLYNSTRGKMHGGKKF